MDLVEFVSARLDEDEATARHSGPARVAWLTLRDDNGNLRYTTVAAGGQGDWDAWFADGNELPEPANVGVVYDPARVLREVAAKRAILAEHEITDRTPKGWTGVGYGCYVCHEDDGCIAPRGYCTTLRALGAIWAGHPDYDPAWTLPVAAGH